MNRKIAAALVGLSILAGIGLGYAAQRMQDAPASASPKPSVEATAVGATFRSGPVKVTGVSLVASKTGGATLVATLGPLEYLHAASVTAELKGKALPVVTGTIDQDDPRMTAEIQPNPIGKTHIGKQWKSGHADLFESEAFVVHGAKVGQTVRVNIEFGDRGRKPTPDAKLDVPVVSAAEVPDAVLFEGPPPKFSGATITVYPGEDRAVMGYTIVSRNGKEDRLDPSTPEQIEGTGPDGAPIAWKKQQGCCILGQLVDALQKPVTVRAQDPSQAEVYDYVDASRVKVGDTVTFRFPFLAGVVKVPFKVVAG